MKKIIFMIIANLILSSYSAGQDTIISQDLKWINLNEYDSGNTTLNVITGWRTRSTPLDLLTPHLLSDDQHVEVITLNKKDYLISLLNDDLTVKQDIPLFNKKGYVYGACVSRDGNCIAFTVGEGDYQQNQSIYVRDRNDSGEFSEPRVVYSPGQTSESSVYVLDMSKDGNTILMIKDGISGEEVHVIENARSQNPKTTFLTSAGQLGGYDKVTDDGLWVYFIVYDYKNPNPDLLHVCKYSHLVNGSWSDPISSILDENSYVPGASDINSDGTLICAGTIIVERKDDKFITKHKIDTQGQTFTRQILSKDGKMIVYSLEEKINYPAPESYLLRYGPMDILPKTGLYYAIFDDSSIYPVKTVKVDEGYWTQFHYSKSLNRLIWTTFKDNPLGDNTKVKPWNQY